VIDFLLDIVVDGVTGIVDRFRSKKKSRKKFQTSNGGSKQ